MSDLLTFILKYILVIVVLVGVALLVMNSVRKAQDSLRKTQNYQWVRQSIREFCRYVADRPAGDFQSPAYQDDLARLQALAGAAQEYWPGALEGPLKTFIDELTTRIKRREFHPDELASLARALDQTLPEAGYLPRPPRILTAYAGGSPVPSRSAAMEPDGPNGSQSPAPQISEQQESAVLARLTERFYGSWSFKIIGMALVAAAGLAIVGDFVVLGGSYSLMKDMGQRAEVAKSEIDSIRDSMKEQFDVQTASQEQFNETLAAKQKELEAQIDAGKQGIKSQAGEFQAATAEVMNNIKAIEAEVENTAELMEEESGDLLDEISDEVIESIKGQTSPITERIADALETVNDEAEELEENGLSGVNERLTALTGTIEKHEQAVAAIASDITAVSGTVSRLTAIEANLRIAEGQQTKLSESIEGASKTAGTIGTDLKAHQDKIATLPTAEALTALSTRIEVAEGSVARLEERLKTLTDKVPTDSPAVSDSAGAVPLSEGDLTTADWKIIQSALAVEPDGDVGKGTRGAIRAYQAKLRVLVSGFLTARQVADLLASAKATP